MVSSILAIRGMPGGWEWIVILVVFGVPILLIFLFVRLVLRNKKENIRLRLEVGKLADELEKERKKATSTEKGNSSEKSG